MYEDRVEAVGDFVLIKPVGEGTDIPPEDRSAVRDKGYLREGEAGRRPPRQICRAVGGSTKHCREYRMQ